MGAIITFIVLLGTLFYGHCVELTQPGSMVLKPGQSLSISCKVSGYSLTDSSYCTHWIRQPAGKALEWFGEVCGDGNTYYKDSLKNRFTVSRDTSSSTVFLKGSSLQTGDSAVYYCAREYGYAYYFDYWGKGTHVTVTQDTPSPPTSLFPLMTCEQQGPTDRLTLACIAGGFLPSSSVTFHWKDTSGKPVSDFTQYPAVQISGSKSYTSVSHLSVNAAEWDAKKTYSCSVNHLSQAGVKDASFQKPVMPKSPTVSLLLEPSGASPPDALICVIRDFYPKSLTVTWRVNGKTLTGSSNTWQSEKQASGLYSASSTMNVDRTKWDRNEEYTCEVLHQQKPIEQKTSRDQSLDTPCLEVTLNPPKARELFVDNQAVLDCVITGGERAAVEGASVTWTPSGTSKESQITRHGHVFRKTSTLTLGQERWFTEQNVECSVQQQNSDKPAITKSFSRNNTGSTVPKVVIYTPSEEEDSEFVSLVCVVTGFSPRDVFVMWTVDDGSYEEGITSEPVESKTGTFSVTSLFNVSTAKWKSPSNITCNVKHSSMANGAAPLTKSVSRATETVSALNCNEEGEEEDELGSLWSTTSSFFTLFLCTLIYSTLLTLIKMKQ